MKTAIYGAGNFGRKFMAGLQESGRTVDFFIDKYASFSSIDNVPVLKPEDLTELSDTEVYVSLAVSPGSDMAQEIAQLLGDKHASKIFLFADVIAANQTIVDQFRKNDWLWISKDPEKMLSDSSIAKLRSLLADNQSRELLDDIVEFRKSFSSESYVAANDMEEYFPDDVDVFGGIDSLRFIDAGAYTGDTLKEAFNQCQTRSIEVDFIASFEPDTTNFKALSETVSKLMEDKNAPRCFLFNSGIWSENTQLKFSDSGTSSSAVTDAADDTVISVPVQSLDTTLYSSRPNFIKMDIEGAEFEALDGARRIITDFRPVLAICVYHRPEDLWRLALKVEQIAPGYRMYLRVHGEMGLSTVLYCLP